MTQLQAAQEMEVSRPTLTRIYAKARQTIADAFVNGKAIFIEGGDYHTDEFWYRCENCHKLMISRQEMSTCSECHSYKLRSILAEKGNSGK
jgi:hypothetical protein